MTPRRALLAAAVTAAAFAPAPAAVATCHYCALPVECDAAPCDRVYELLDAAPNAPHAESSHTICHTIEDAAPWLVACH